MHYGPLSHNRPSTAYDSCKALGDEVGMSAKHSGMDGKVVYTLFGLLDECVAVYFPCEFRYIAVDFLQSLVYWHSTHRYWAVAYNPFACFVDVVAGREVHQCVATPIAAPYSFAYFFFYAR